MATTEERMRILKMIQEGKITAEDGSRLLAALRDAQQRPSRLAPPPPPAPPARLGKGWLRVRVTDTASGRTKVNVNLPLGLLDAGLNIATQFAPEINFAQVAEAVRSGELEGKIIDVMDEEDGEHIEVFVD